MNNDFDMKNAVRSPNIEKKFAKYLVGQKIDHAEEDTLYLGNGMALTFYESEFEFCSGAAGAWSILQAEKLDAIITGAEAYCAQNDWADVKYLKVNILHNQNIVAQGSGCAAPPMFCIAALSVRVQLAENTIDDFEVLECY